MKNNSLVMRAMEEMEEMSGGMKTADSGRMVSSIIVLFINVESSGLAGMNYFRQLRSQLIRKISAKQAGC